MSCSRLRLPNLSLHRIHMLGKHSQPQRFSTTGPCLPTTREAYGTASADPHCCSPVKAVTAERIFSYIPTSRSTPRNS